MKSYLSVDLYLISLTTFLNGSDISRNSILTTDILSIYCPTLLCKTTERKIIATNRETTEAAITMKLPVKMEKARASNGSMYPTAIIHIVKLNINLGMAVLPNFLRIAI